MRLAVSEGQPLFTFGLLRFALSSVDSLSLRWSPITNIDIFLFLSNVLFGHTQNLRKNNVGLKFEWGLWDKY